MTRLEFRAADGTVCCSTTNPNHLCPSCEARLKAQSTPQPETASEPRMSAGAELAMRIAHDWKGYFASKLDLSIVPDSYAPGLAARRAAESAATPTDYKPGWPKPAAAPRLSAGEIPDGYEMALAERRKEA